VTPLDQPLVLPATLARLERRAGNLLEGSFQPYVRIASNFSVVAGISHWRKRVDRYNYAAGQDQVPAIDPNVLAQDSKANATSLSAGLSFAHSGVRRDGRIGLPLDATVSAQMVAGSSAGRVEARRSVVFQMRVYGRVF
jgi:hypothetical protein